MQAGNVCVYCGSESGPFHLDHVVPKSRGGSDQPENLVTACARCNLSKHCMLPSEWLPSPSPAIVEMERAALVAIWFYGESSDSFRKPRWRTPPEAAKEVGIDPKKIIDEIRAGHLEAIDLAARNSKRPRYRISDEAFADWLASRTVRPPSKPARRRKQLNVREYF